jgi:hypothetical protein
MRDEEGPPRRAAARRIGRENDRRRRHVLHRLRLFAYARTRAVDSEVRYITVTGQDREDVIAIVEALESHLEPEQPVAPRTTRRWIGWFGPLSKPFSRRREFEAWLNAQRQHGRSLVGWLRQLQTSTEGEIAVTDDDVRSIVMWIEHLSAPSSPNPLEILFLDDETD